MEGVGSAALGGTPSLSSYTSGTSGSSSQTFSSMQALQKANPKLYNLMIQGCMESFCQVQEQYIEDYKKIMRENIT